jgi:predicted dienelactone hydrolase
MERLASHGIAVLAPDHTGNTLWDALANTNPEPSAALLATRVADIRFVLDAALDPASPGGPAFPPTLRRFDASRVGVMGHSLGSATAGLVAQTDPRARAAAGIAAPMAFFEPTSMPAIHVPLLMLLAGEDHSIGTLGNAILRANFNDANPPARLVEVTDTGHWSWSDLPGIVPYWDGCARAQRTVGDNKGDDFDFIDPDVARGIAASYVAAFFAEQLLADANGGKYVDAARPQGTVAVTTRR